MKAQATIYIETDDYSLSLDMWEKLRKRLPLTYNACLATMKESLSDKADIPKLLKAEGYLFKTMRGLRLLDDITMNDFEDIFRSTANMRAEVYNDNNQLEIYFLVD